MTNSTKQTPIHRLPTDLWGRAYDVTHYAPTSEQRPELAPLRETVFAELKDGTCEDLTEALRAFARAYGRDIHGKDIPLARAHFCKEAGAIALETENWLAGQFKPTSPAASRAFEREAA